MALTLVKKKEIVENINQQAMKSSALCTADYCGLTAEQISELRIQARKNNVYLKVSQNTLARRAVEGTDFECMKDSFKGPTLLAFSGEEPCAAPRLIRDFAKENKSLEIKAIALDGTLYGPEKLEALASLPTKDEAIAQLLRTMNAPLTQFARTINEPMACLARALSEVSKVKEAE